MKLTFAQLCEVGQEARERALVSTCYKRGVPLNGKYGTRHQDLILAEGMARHILKHGPIVIEGFTIGLSPAASHSALLRATNNVKFAGLKRRLRKVVMAGFENELIQRWSDYKQKRGDFVSSDEQSDADRFSNQTFRGFD